jgi:hypothetical protein
MEVGIRLVQPRNGNKGESVFQMQRGREIEPFVMAEKGAPQPQCQGLAQVSLDSTSKGMAARRKAAVGPGPLSRGKGLSISKHPHIQG